MKLFGILLGAAVVLLVLVVITLLRHSTDADRFHQETEELTTTEGVDLPPAFEPTEGSPTVSADPPVRPADPDAVADDPTPPPSAKDLLAVLSPNVQVMMEQEDETDRIHELFALMEELPEQASVERIVLGLIEAKRRHLALVEAFESEPWDQSDPAARQQRVQRMAALEKQYRQDQRSGLRNYLSADVYEQVIQNWGDLAQDDE